MSEVVRLKIEINTETSKWRFYDFELKVYSGQEYNTKREAVKAASKYRKKYDLLMPKRKLGKRNP